MLVTLQACAGCMVAGDIAAVRTRTTASPFALTDQHVDLITLHTQDAGSWVVAPRHGGDVKGVVHFLGGAFAGAAPQVRVAIAFCVWLY